MRPLWVMVAGPYRTGAPTDAERAANLRLLNRTAWEVFQRGHLPVVGVNLALPVIDVAGDEHYERIMMPLSLAAADRCDAVLRIGGPSSGADAEVDRIRARGGLVLTRVEDLPRIPAEPPSEGSPKLYDELAAWWPLLSPPAEYVEEAAFYERRLLAACARPPQTLLELGSGGGNNASHLKRRFAMVLVDRSPAMLAVSRALNPECEHVQGDMRTVRLGRQFDCVFVHDAVCYITTESDLRRVMETAFVHCRPGGAVLFAPDYVRETFRPSTDHGGYDGEQRGMRYLEWTSDPDPSDTSYVVDYAYLLRDEDGSMRVEQDRHVEGLFTRADWLRLLADVGFEPAAVAADPSGVGPESCGACGVFVGMKPR